ncbi:MAG: HD domain-containing protein [Promethearchaeota archaeon]|nr:MAG: HD domain-containing protein [Candidatus Lokiarchaeota archaeon]
MERIFSTIDLKFCDASAISILKSKAYHEIKKIVPEWAKLIQKGLEINEEETHRTIKHIFRSICVFFFILDEEIELKLSSQFKRYLKSNLNRLYETNPDLFLYILLYHDIGRPFNREWHTFESANLIEKQGLLSPKTSVPKKYIRILLGVIRHHLLLGTIFTGESSYLGALILLKDRSLHHVWESKEETELFFQILILFTVIDIMGYQYSKIFDHYLDYYLKIKDNLVIGFNRVRALQNLEEKEHSLYLFFHRLDEEKFKWRVACALRIFQFANTTKKLTEDFYFRKIDEGLERIGSNWSLFSRELSAWHPWIQFKYALPLTMILAAKSFSRTPINKQFVVNGDLFLFWDVCASKVKEIKTERKKPAIYNVIFEFPRNWFLNHDILQLLNKEKLFSLIRTAQSFFNYEFESYQLYIKYKLRKG